MLKNHHFWRDRRTLLDKFSLLWLSGYVKSWLMGPLLYCLFVCVSWVCFLKTLDFFFYFLNLVQYFLPLGNFPKQRKSNLRAQYGHLSCSSCVWSWFLFSLCSMPYPSIPLFCFKESSILSALQAANAETILLVLEDKIL